MHRLMGLLLILFVMVGVAEAGAWVIETVDSAGEVGKGTSLALDSSGNPHISYYDETNENLKYAHWDGSSWQIEIVDSSLQEYGGDTSLTLDSSDNPHISYYDDTNENLKYARWDGTDWVIEVVDSAEEVGKYTSLALDFENNPHISYFDESNEDLKYARWDGFDWQIETVDSEGEVGRYTSLDLFYSEIPIISYEDRTNGYLKCAWWNYHEWIVVTIDSSGHTGRFTSLALDSSDIPHISYYDNAYYTLKYAYWDGSSWQIETADGQGYAGWYSSLALDSSDNSHISYNHWGGPSLYYTRGNGYSWQNEYVDGGGRYTSIALDSSDNPSITYLDVSNYDLKYAYWDPDASPVESASLSVQPTDDGVLLNWSVVGDTPASVSVLRSVNEDQPIALSGALSGSATSWLDVSAEAGVEYAYWLEVTELDGTVSRFGPSEIVVPGAISELTLSDPYPNPASSTLTVNYELAVEGAVSLNIYDLSGRLVETLVSGEQTAGRHSVNWDSSASATGVYLLRLETAGEAITKRAVISR